MNLDPVLLMAYVDGQLSTEEMHRVDAELARSPEAVAYIADLMASKLPSCQQAFSQQRLPAVPASLSASIEALARAHATPKIPMVAAANDRTATAFAPTAAKPIRSRLRVAPAWLGAAFAAGIACSVVGMSWLGPSGSSAKLASNRAASSAAPWVEAAADYQQLYSRETLVQVRADAEASAATVAAIRRDDRLAIQVPDLTADGLEFKRVQRLRFHGRPLVQIVYLPKQGAPIALCVMAESNKADNPVAGQEIAGMDVVTWRNKELGYALIGSAPGVDLTVLAKRIAANRVDQLFNAV